MTSVWLGVDVGGTFTDVALVVDGDVTTAKVPTTDDQSRGVLAGVEVACDRAGVDPPSVDRFRHGTTAAVNALLEGDGAETALVTTDGFADVLVIGRQDRPELYDPGVARTDPLVPAERRYTVDERATTEGIETPVDDAEVEALAGRIEADSVAVSLLHSYAHPDNERRVAETLRDRLDVPVAASHEVLPTVREYERTATTAAEAYVTPVVDDYLERLETRADDAGLPTPRVMQSNGGIADAATVRDHAVTTVLSGPAAGVVSATLLGEDVVTFDMGGTSSDVSLVEDGRPLRTTDADVGGHPVRVPMVDVHTVGAGGGSIAWVDEGGALRVGPRSAGADPGPVCYGEGGTEPTVTDAAVVLGYLGPGTTLGEDLTLDAAAAEQALSDLAARTGLDDATAAARGVYRVANAAMTRAIRTVTVERGHDPRGFALAAFGGAGPMHAAALADRLGVDRVVVPPAGGVRSAVGLLGADESHDAVRTVRIRLDDADRNRVESAYAALRERVLDASADPDAATIDRTASCRYAGQAFELPVDAPDPFDPETVRKRFVAAHDDERGYTLEDEPVEMIDLAVTATTTGDPPTITHDPGGDPRVDTRRAVFGDTERETPVFDPGRLLTDRVVDGPAVFEGAQTTTVLPPGWAATPDPRGALVLTREDER